MDLQGGERGIKYKPRFSSLESFPRWRSSQNFNVQSWFNPKNSRDDSTPVYLQIHVYQIWKRPLQAQTGYDSES